MTSFGMPAIRPFHSRAWSTGSLPGAFDRICAGLAIAAAIAMEIAVPTATTPNSENLSAQERSTIQDQWGPARKETFVAFYAGHPWYHRSDVHLTRPDGTDLKLKDMGWDGDAFYPPIDGGVRAVRWTGAFGGMIDFLHNKAISRLGKGSHGREISNPVIETVATEGTIKGAPAPEKLLLTDYFRRLEFTHGHNTLMWTGMMRFGGITRLIRPYAGIGAGVALPHTEVRFTDDKQRTSEYQYGGPAVQALAGLELRKGNISYFLEYKFTAAWINAQITGDSSWLNWDMIGDLWRQSVRWRLGEEPKYGRVKTVLASHQVFIGGGYWLQHGTTAP